jgi:hypothetical protein
VLNIHNLGNADKQPGLYSAREIDLMPLRPLFSLDEPQYPVNDGIYDEDETRWRIAHKNEPFDLHELIDDFCNWYNRVIELKGYQLTTKISSDLPRFFAGNLLMPGFLLWDLASFTKGYLGAGGVHLEIHSEPFKRNWHSVYFSFMVPGLGIPLAKEKMLFLPNSNGKTSKKNQASSNLYYAGMIAGALDGVIRIQNEIGFGTKYIAKICLQNKP